MYYATPKSLNARLLTLLSNRVGDALILVALFLILGKITHNYRLWDASRFFLSFRIKDLVPINLVFFAAITKRAQLPFRAWLPAAIAAPTPVSSLVHSSTLVTAGVYILIRANGVYDSPPTGSFFLIGCITSLVAGASACFEIDIKKIIALSTLRQLGIIIAAIGLQLPRLALGHLIAHAFFKALLFVAAGNLIHTFLNTQDFRRFGGGEGLILRQAAAATAKMSLAGLPGISAYFSKEPILETALGLSLDFG